MKINDAGPVRAAVSSSTGGFSMPLPPGKWLLYPGYSTVFGPTVSTAGTPVTIAAKTVSTKDVTMAYRAPTDGSVSGTTRLLDAPTEGLGIAGVEACSSPASTSPGITCGIITMQIGPSGEYQLAVPAGTWWGAELELVPGSPRWRVQLGGATCRALAQDRGQSGHLVRAEFECHVRGWMRSMVGWATATGRTS